MDTLIEAIPTWALCYLFNSDATGLTDEEIALIDQWYTENKVMGITTARNKRENVSLTSHTIRLSDFLPKWWTATLWYAEYSR